MAGETTQYSCFQLDKSCKYVVVLGAIYMWYYKDPFTFTFSASDYLQLLHVTILCIIYMCWDFKLFMYDSPLPHLTIEKP